MKKERKRIYEGMYILSATLSDESRKKAFEKITDGIVQKEGEILKIYDQGRRRLAYEIKGKREGHYYVVYFSSPTQAILEHVKNYRLHEDIVRFMMVQAQEVPESLEFNPIRIQG